MTFQKDDNGKTVYDDEGSPIIVGLRPKALEMLQKLTELARNDSRKCVFISYKEFVEGEIAELPVVKQLHEAFDTVTHYDIAPGMNFEGYKIFVTFGYPKVKWSVIKREARKQYAHEPERQNFDYTTTTQNRAKPTAAHTVDIPIHALKISANSSRPRNYIRQTAGQDTPVGKIPSQSTFQQSLFPDSPNLRQRSRI